MAGLVYKTYTRMDHIVRNVKDFLLFPKRLLAISRMIGKPTYYPELDRKTRKEMWMDNFRWLCRYHELNTFYTSYGLDIRGYRNADDFISHRDFCAMRNKGNQSLKMTISGNYNYIVLLRDKYAFAAYLASTIGRKSVIQTVALLSNGEAFLCQEEKWTSVDSLLIEDSVFVYKILDGECADGVMLVKVKNGVVFADDHEYTKEDFVRSIRKKNIIVQNVVKQHSALCAFGTRSVNTIRIVTIKGKSGAVGVFSAFLRLSVSADSFVDNRAKGGLGVGVDLQTGQLMKYGFPHDSFGVKMEEHPLSGIQFEGYQLPYWKETVELVSAAHRQFYELQSIGWDVVLTEDGPALLEGNDDWEIGGPQDTYGGLKQRWNELVNG